MAERMLAEHKAGQEEREVALEQLQRETRERLSRMEAGHVDAMARVAADKAALQQKESAIDEREARLLALETKLAGKSESRGREEGSCSDPVGWVPTLLSCRSARGRARGPRG